MEFDFEDISDVIKAFFSPESTDDGSTTNIIHTSSPTLEHNETVRSDETKQQQSKSTQCEQERNYCFIIFNNPRWSQLLRRQSGHTNQQTTQAATTIKEEPTNLSLDDEFTMKLRELFNHYMQHTQRPFPIKYFIDFTDP